MSNFWYVELSARNDDVPVLPKVSSNPCKEIKLLTEPIRWMTDVSRGGAGEPEGAGVESTRGYRGGERDTTTWMLRGVVMDGESRGEDRSCPVLIGVDGNGKRGILHLADLLTSEEPSVFCELNFSCLYSAKESYKEEDKTSVFFDENKKCST